MKLHSEIVRVQRDGEYITTGSGVVKTLDLDCYTIDGDVRHDAFAAHALMQAIADAQEAEGLPGTLPHITGFIQTRAAELMREWGFEYKVTP